VPHLVSGATRPFDDGHWPADYSGKADCFLCGKKVDPLDPRRGTYTANAQACEPLPAHLGCLEEGLREDPTGMRVWTAFMGALNTMTGANAQALRRAARVSIVPQGAA